MITRTLKTMVSRDSLVFGETTTYIEICDEAAGEYLEVSQSCHGKIMIDPDEWPYIRKAIDVMMDEISKHGE
jgi:hypothetical protein